MAHSQAVAERPNPTADLGTAPLDSVKEQLGFSGEGLTQSEAQSRLRQYGFNELLARR